MVDQANILSEAQKGRPRAPADSTAPVTVIIPVRNRPELLKESLSSVIQGTLWPAEILVIGNGHPEEIQNDKNSFNQWKDEVSLSIQNQPSAARKYSAMKISFLVCKRIGPAAARNLGAREASQHYVAFLDSDDLWKSHKLARQISFLEKRPHLKACHNLEDWIKHGKSLNIPLRLRPVTGRPLLESMEICLISASSLLIERSHFLELNGFDERFLSCEDYEFWIRHFLSHTMGCLQEPLVIKRSGFWKQVSGSGLLDLQRLRALLVLRKPLIDRGLKEELWNVARKKAGILLQRKDSIARHAARLLRAIES